MSEFSVPPLSVGYDSRWVHVPLSGDIGEWAQRATADYLAKNGGHKKQVKALLEGAGEIVRRATDAVMALILMPVATEGIRAIVRFCPVDMSEADLSSVDLASVEMPAVGEDVWSAMIGDITPDSPWEESPEITDMTTKAGPCRRVVHRVVEGEGTTRAITEHVVYAWVFPQYAAGAFMVTSFLNLAEAGRWRGALDELAAAVELEPAP
jgi:hypothetical protein